MILITSAAYLGAEFQSELGKIPPSFLPVGNRRLYSFQRDCLNANDKVVLTVPEQFEVPQHDLRQIESMDIEILPIPEGMSLGESIVCALNLSGYSDGPLTILHGDTLVYDIPEDKSDIIAVSEVEDNYEWATFDGERVSAFHPYDDQLQPCDQVVNGYFRFSCARTLIQSFVRARGDFIEGINLYANLHPLSAHVTDGWYDFGHLHTYFRSKTHVSTARSFNSLRIEDGVVTKLSDMPNKMAAESNWFSSLPDTLKKFAPNFLGEIQDEQGVNGYRIEYQCISSLNELYVFGELPVFVWDKILKACSQFIEACKSVPAPASETTTFKQFVVEKTEQRLSKLAETTSLDLNKPWTFNGQAIPSIQAIHQATQPHIPDNNEQSITHGDFCFSNVLYDFRAQSIKVIDPRGMGNDGSLSIYGYANYDIAKLAHSIIGKYDFIIAGYFDLEIDTETNTVNFEVYQNDIDRPVRDRFEALCAQKFGLTPIEICAMQIQLFLSMLPLHADKPQRQMALLANAMKLYLDLEQLQ